jgi:hypothetical protein
MRGGTRENPNVRKNKSQGDITSSWVLKMIISQPTPLALAHHVRVSSGLLAKHLSLRLAISTCAISAMVEWWGLWCCRHHWSTVHLWCSRLHKWRLWTRCVLELSHTGIATAKLGLSLRGKDRLLGLLERHRLLFSNRRLDHGLSTKHRLLLLHTPRRTWLERLYAGHSRRK